RRRARAEDAQGAEGEAAAGADERPVRARPPRGGDRRARTERRRARAAPRRGLERYRDTRRTSPRPRRPAGAARAVGDLLRARADLNWLRGRAAGLGE